MNLIQQKAIAHYDRMIAWAEKQPQNSPCSSEIMIRKIDEDWSSEYCEYCETFTLCDDCPLTEENATCCGTLWEKMNVAETWGEWVEKAKLVKQYIIDKGEIKEENSEYEIIPLVIDTHKMKYFGSDNFNFTFNKETGYTETWGKNRNIDPEYCEYGPMIADIEISTICNMHCKECYKDNTHVGENMSFEAFKDIFHKFPRTLMFLWLFCKIYRTMVKRKMKPIAKTGRFTIYFHIWFTKYYLGKDYYQNGKWIIMYKIYDDNCGFYRWKQI